MIDAETGSGKTVAVLSTILSQKKENERIIIFTKMLTQMNAWFRELALINDFNRKLGKKTYSMIPLVGKKHLCNLVTDDVKHQFTQIGCSLFACNFHKNYYLHQANREEADSYSQEFNKEIRKHLKQGVSFSELLWIIDNKLPNLGCTYLAIKAALKHADLIITTFPFLTSSFLRDHLKEHAALDIEKTTIIIDEAHNLARGSIATLSYRAIDRAYREIGSHILLDKLLSLQNKPGLHSLFIDPTLLEDLQQKGQEYLLREFDRGGRDISYALQVHNFLREVNECFITADKHFSLYLKDPRLLLNPIKIAKKLVLISGTFRPLDFFADFLGIQEAHKISITSEKARKNRIVLTTTDPQLCLKYEFRSKKRFLYYGKVLKELVDHIPGHTLIFTPNYELTIVFGNLLESNYIESPNKDAHELISAIEQSKEKVVVIAPARGKISEGIEFVRDEQSLVSSVIVAGLPYPPPTAALKAIIKEYSSFWGYERAINYMSYLQGIVTIRQCLGRMIRSEKDIGSWIILDNRISKMAVFPKAVECKTTKQMIKRLSYFYQSKGL
jgi:Rad3-related DNA helicase